MTVLVTGACGLLGAHLMVGLSPRHRLLGVDRNRWWGDHPAEVLTGDLSSPGVVGDIIARTKPRVIVHCAAMVDVDACERDPVAAYRRNAALTREVARAAGRECLVVYISTDGIFLGDSPFATEDQLPCPKTVYGRSKLHGEWEVQQATPHHLIVRTNFYGWSSQRKQTSAEWLYQALESHAPITLFDDFFFTPIYVVEFVERIERLLDASHRGIFHVCGRDRVSKYQFGLEMAAQGRLSTSNVQCGSIERAGLLADRPRDMSLKCDRFRGLIGLELPGCGDGLRRFLSDRERPLSARFSDIRLQVGDRTRPA